MIPDSPPHLRRDHCPASPVAAPADLSRRGFLKQSGGAASAAALLSLPIAETVAQAAETKVPPAAAPAQLLGPGAVPTTVMVNGKPQKVMIEPRDTLATVLRDRLGLLGTKIGCDRGGCGACTVWVAGSPTLACMTLALDVAGLPGKEPLAVTTVEGLAKGRLCIRCNRRFWTRMPFSAASVRREC
jgi:xanthine dehydrogenase YagT iron-sulfur-binding subunit